MDARMFGTGAKTAGTANTMAASWIGSRMFGTGVRMCEIGAKTFGTGAKTAGTDAKTSGIVEKIDATEVPPNVTGSGDRNRTRRP